MRTLPPVNLIELIARLENEILIKMKKYPQIYQRHIFFFIYFVLTVKTVSIFFYLSDDFEVCAHSYYKRINHTEEKIYKYFISFV